MAVTPRQQVRGEFVRLAHRGTGLREFTLAAAGVLARTVPFDGICLLTLDPATLLPTGEVVHDALPPEATARITEIEFAGADVNAFAALVGRRQPAALLSQTTAGNLDRSQRHREVRSPHGFGDELRAVLTADATPWGALTLLRAADRAHFTAAEAEAVASIAGDLAEGVRRALLLGGTRRCRDEHGETVGSAGLVQIATDNTITAADIAAQRWLAELREADGGHPLPHPLAAVAARARRIADPSVTPGASACARVRTISGQWLLTRGWALPDKHSGTVAVILEPAPAHQLAPLIAAAYGLTSRERRITQLVARGLGTTAIANHLHLSPWTVQDHLKSIFDKTGTSSRGELIHHIFFQHYAPQLTEYTCPERPSRRQ